MNSSALSITKLDHQFGNLKVLNNLNASERDESRLGKHRQQQEHCPEQLYE